MSQFVTEANVFVGQSIASREELIRFVCEKALELGYASDANAAYDAFMASW